MVFPIFGKKPGSFLRLQGAFRGYGTGLLDMAMVVNLIGNTKTQVGLEVRCVVDEGSYAKGIKISDKELASFNITKHAFHGEWNYIIRPVL